MSSGIGDFLVLAVGPGGVFVVEGPGSEAAVQDADETVAEGSEGLVVGVAEGASVVVERSGAGAVGERAERPLVDGIREAAVADEPGQSDAAVARSAGDG